MTSPEIPDAAENTDRELWRETEGDAYADSIHVTKGGGIGINCGGMVYVKPIREWHRLASSQSPGEIPDAAVEAAELLPCPFCGGEAERVDIEDGDNAGGSCICCKQCFASSNVEFEFKENFVSNWNRRAALPHLAAGRAEAAAETEPVAWLPVMVDRSREDPTPEETGEYETVCAVGVYYIDMYFGSDSYGWRVTLNGADDIADKDDPDAAKAAAQADYEQRIRSALVSAPAAPSDAPCGNAARYDRGECDFPECGCEVCISPVFVPAVPAAPAAPSETHDDEDRCIACDKPFKPGDRVLNDVSGGSIHIECCGPDRESYVGPGDPLPKGYVWQPAPAAEAEPVANRAELIESLSNWLDPEIGFPNDDLLRRIHLDIELRGRKDPAFAVSVHHRNIALSAVAAALRASHLSWHDWLNISEHESDAAKAETAGTSVLTIASEALSEAVAALKACVDRMTDDHPGSNEYWQAVELAEAVIAKSEGR